MVDSCEGDASIRKGRDYKQTLGGGGYNSYTEIQILNDPNPQLRRLQRVYYCMYIVNTDCGGVVVMLTVSMMP